MTIQEFVDKAQKYNASNTFEPGHKDVNQLPNVIKQFYEETDPIDVEVPFRKYGNLHFIPFSILQKAYMDYGFFEAGTVVFASSNGDPFFIIDDAIYTTYESDYMPEFVASSLDEFFSLMKI